MQTRSKSKVERISLENNDGRYKVDIDFDEASRMWRENKKQVSSGVFVYLCGYVFPGKNKKCTNRCMNGLDMCYIHRYKRLRNSDSSSSDSD